MQYQLSNLIRSLYLQPPGVDMPEGGFPANFPFLYNPLLPMDVQQLTRVVPRDVLIWGINGLFTGVGVPPAPLVQPTGVFAQLVHIHNGKSLPLSTKPVPIENMTGSGQSYFPVMPTKLVPAGDSLMLEVRSQDRANSLNVELDLLGTTVNWDNADKYQKLVLNSKLDLLDQIDPPNKDLVGDAPPYGASPLVRTSSKYFNIPAPGAGPTTIFSYQVPPGQRTRIFEHALVSTQGGVGISGSVIWRFLVNKWPLPGLGAQFATIGAFETPDKVVIWLEENDLFEVTVEVPLGAQPQNALTAYRIGGWTAPINAVTTSRKPQ